MRADDIGAAFRRDRGEQGSGPGDGAFLGGLASGVASRRRRLRRRVALALLLGVASVAATVTILRSRGDDGAASPGDKEIAGAEPVYPSDPDAAILLESARLRLDGFGDPAMAAPRLRAVARLYPETREARDAVALLRRHGTGDGR